MSFKTVLKVCGAILLALIVIACSQAEQPDFIPGADTVRPEFSEVHETLSQGTDVPVLLPSEMPPEALPFYSSVFMSDAGQYEIAISAAEDCDGAGYCSFGMLGGEQVEKGMEPVEKIYSFHLDPSYQPLKRSEEKMGPASLAHDIKGFFVPWVCGASCDTAKVFWEQNGYRYKVGVQMADKETVVAIANSAINNQFQGAAKPD